MAASVGAKRVPPAGTVRFRAGVVVSDAKKGGGGVEWLRW